MVTCLRAGMPHFGMQAWNGRDYHTVWAQHFDGHFICKYFLVVVRHLIGKKVYHGNQKNHSLEGALTTANMVQSIGNE